MKNELSLYRSLDRGFAQTFSRNLLEQGFAEPARIAFTEKQQSLLPQNQQETEVLVSVVDTSEPPLLVAPDPDVAAPRDNSLLKEILE